MKCVKDYTKAMISMEEIDEFKELATNLCFPVDITSKPDIEHINRVGDALHAAYNRGRAEATAGYVRLVKGKSLKREIVELMCAQGHLECCHEIAGAVVKLLRDKVRNGS